MAQQRPEPSPAIDLEAVCRRSPVMRAVYRLFGGPMRRFLAIDRVNEHIRIWEERPETVNAFAHSVEYLGIRSEVEGGAVLEELGDGPLIIASNHPFGSAEALVLGDLLCARRPDLKILATELLQRIPALRPYLISVDSYGHWNPSAANASPLRAALAHLRAGGALLLFPAGRVSHFHASRLRVTDPFWTPHAVRLARASRARILPVHVAGRNGFTFQAAGLLHPMLRTVLLIREFYRTVDHRTVHVHFRRPVDPSALPRDPERATAELRSRVYAR